MQERESDYVCHCIFGVAHRNIHRYKHTDQSHIPLPFLAWYWCNARRGRATDIRIRTRIRILVLHNRRYRYNSSLSQAQTHTYKHTRLGRPRCRRRCHENPKGIELKLAFHYEFVIRKRR